MTELNMRGLKYLDKICDFQFPSKTLSLENKNGARQTFLPVGLPWMHEHKARENKSLSAVAEVALQILSVSEVPMGSVLFRYYCALYHKVLIYKMTFYGA